MAVKLRLQRKGRRKAPFYHIVAADSRSPRDGRFIEKLGTYNPLTVPASIELNNERAYYWINVGAQPTDTVRAILRHKGVLYQKHLLEGVKKGALTQEEADAKLQAWIEQKEGRIARRREETSRKKAEAAAKMDGTPKPRAVKLPEPVAAETPEEETSPAADENAAANDEAQA